MVDYHVEKELAELSSSGSTRKRLTLTSWGGRPAKLDLRTWRTVQGDEIPAKGLTLTDEEAQALEAALAEYLEK